MSTVRLIQSIACVMGVVASSQAFAAPLTPANLGPASFQELVSAGPLTQQGFDPLLPEVLSLDYQTGNGSQAVTSLIASPIGPQGDIQYSVSHVFGDSVGPGFSAGGTVTIRYGAAVVPLVPDAPNVPVQTIIKVLAFLSVTESEENTGQILDSQGNAYVRIDGFSFPGGSSTGTFNISVAIDPNDPGIPSSLEINQSFSGQFMPNEAFAVEKAVGVGSTARRPDVTYEGIGVIDPQFAIDPEFMVDYNGVLTPATQLYTIIYSEGIVPIPEPGCLAMLGSGLSLLIARRPSRHAAPRAD